MLASNSNQISSFIPFMNQSTSLEKSIQIHDDHENENYSISRFEQSLPPSLQLVDCYNYNFNPFSPFLEEELFLGHILYSQRHQLLGTASNRDPEIGFETANYNTNNNEATITTQKPSSSQKKAKLTEHTSTKKPISRRRSGKKDRHSKICTSKGPRDRRMRLSLEIARSFFDLQDMLGFDKASKTVEWLFSKSRSAIKELKDKYNNNDATKSGYEEGSNDVRKISVHEEVAAGRDQKKRRKLRTVDKESRYKARARARERTRAKRDFEGNPVLLEERQQTHVSSHTENEIILGSKAKNSPSFISNHCEDKLISKEPCSYDIHLPASSMDMAATLSFDSLKPSPAGMKLMELDEMDCALIFYGE